MEIKKILSENLKPLPSPDELVFGKLFTDHMFSMDYDEGIGWHNPVITPYQDIPMSPAAMVLHYGQAVFEGMKAYHADDGRALLFRPAENFRRMNRSDERMCIPHFDEDFALEALLELLRVERRWIPTAENTTLYIRPFVFATQAALGVHPANKYKFMIILSPVGPYYPEGLDPVRIYVEDDYVRAVRGGIGYTKATANYAISLKGQEKAKALGYTQVLWLDGIERRFIEEVGTTNVFFKIGGEIITPALDSGSILPGITRSSAMELLKSWGYTVTERRLTIDEVFAAHAEGRLEEAFGTGTAAVISPIGELNRGGEIITFGGGRTGETTQRLYDSLTGIQYGRLPDPFGWTYEVR